MFNSRPTSPYSHHLPIHKRADFIDDVRAAKGDLETAANRNRPLQLGLFGGGVGAGLGGLGGALKAYLRDESYLKNILGGAGIGAGLGGLAGAGLGKTYDKDLLRHEINAALSKMAPEGRTVEVTPWQADFIKGLFTK